MEIPCTLCSVAFAVHLIDSGPEYNYDTAELEQRIQQSQDSIRAMVEVQPEQLSRFLNEIEAIKDAEERKFNFFNRMELGKLILLGMIVLAGGVLLIFGTARIRASAMG